MHNGRTMHTGYKDFECTICYEIFLYPVCLPCKHRFCKACLDKHIDNNTMCCPICRSRVSNWLRQLRRSNADIVDRPFWDKVQMLYPLQVEKRMNGTIDNESCLLHFWKRLSTFSDKEKNRSSSVHEALLDSGQLQREWEEDWHGWPEPIFQVCRNILQAVNDCPINQTFPSVNDIPIRRLAKPGEIHQEYEQFLEKEREEKRQKDEENFRLSERMIRMIEEDEKREEEERVQQLRKDEELAKLLAEEAAVGAENEEGPRLQTTPRRKTRGIPKLLQNNSPSTSGCCTPLRSPRGDRCLDTPSTSKDPSTLTCHAIPSTSSGRCQPPLKLETQSESKENIFAKFWTSTPSSKHSSHKISSHKEHSTLSDSKTPSISDKAFSHFAPVRPGPSNGPQGKKFKEMPSTSRCSSGSDSIGQELNHFKPIRSSPTTPPKDGSRELVPKVVVPQRGVNMPFVDMIHIPHHDLLAADVSLDELETSINLEKQLEEDRLLAKKIQSQFDQEMQMPVKTDYNLRKRKRSSGNVKKKVSLDRTQSTLDNLLIK